MTGYLTVCNNDPVPQEEMRVAHLRGAKNVMQIFIEDAQKALEVTKLDVKDAAKVSKALEDAAAWLSRGRHDNARQWLERQSILEKTVLPLLPDFNEQLFGKVVAGTV